MSIFFVGKLNNEELNPSQVPMSECIEGKLI